MPLLPRAPNSLTPGGGRGHTVHAPPPKSPHPGARPGRTALHCTSSTCVCSSPGGRGSPFPQLWAGSRKDTEKAEMELTRLTPSMAFLRGRVCETKAVSQSCILGPRVRFGLLAPAREQSPPRARGTPELRCPTCPTWGAAPPSPGTGAFPALAGHRPHSICQTLPDSCSREGVLSHLGPTKPALCSKRLYPRLVQQSLSGGVYFVPEARGSC